MSASRSFLLAAVITSISVGAWAATPAGPGGTSAPPPARAGGPGPGRGRGPQLPANLEGAMNDMDRAYKALKAEATDPAKLEQSLKDVAVMQRDAAISKTLTPGKVNRLTGDKKTEAAESYRTMMVGLMKSLMELEDAIAAKKPDDIKKGFAEIDQIMKQGHDEFAPQQ